MKKVHKEKEQACTSMAEFGKKFFPYSFKKQLKASTNPRTQGIKLARESLDILKQRLANN